jgi:hypothetical protein
VSWSPPSFLAGVIFPCEWAPGRGSAKPIAYDAPGRSTRGGREWDNGGGYGEHWSAQRMGHPDRGCQRVWPGVRRAGLPRPEPGADAGPAAPQGATLIQERLNSAVHMDCTAASRQPLLSREAGAGRRVTAAYHRPREAARPARRRLAAPVGSRPAGRGFCRRPRHEPSHVISPLRPSSWWSSSRRFSRLNHRLLAPSRGQSSGLDKGRRPVSCPAIGRPLACPH